MENKIWSKLKSGCSKLGPGVITGASDDDPSGILTYLQAGAVLGLKSLWTALFTLPLMYAIQEMCGRLGFVTNKGLMRLIKENYSKLVLYPIAFISVVVITINLGADLLAIGVVLEKMTALPRLFWLPVTAISILIFTIFFCYYKFVRVLKWLTFCLFFYILTVFLLHLNWREALQATLRPAFDFSKTTILLITAIFGTTISPYLFFWQASEEKEEREEQVRQKHLQKFLVTKHELKMIKEDTLTGMILSNTVAWFIIAGASFLGARYGLAQITTFDEAALVLQPLLGNLAFFFFSLGIIGVGLLAIPVLAGSVGYILAETFNWKEGLNKTFRQARGFYLAIIGAAVGGILLSLFGLGPVKLLIYTAVFYTLATPFLIFFILRLTNNKKIMRGKINTPLSNILGIITLFFAAFLTITYLASCL